MPLKTETADIGGYFDESRTPANVSDLPSMSTTLSELLDRQETPYKRWPVRNREPRTPINSHKRAIIHERDGGICRLCGTGGHLLTVDHIIPRSAFTADQLHIADRSDNLISACWPCNEAKSNYEREQHKRMGVVAQCWYCQNPAYCGDSELELPYQVNKVVFCGQCGISHVPSVDGWVL